MLYDRQTSMNKGKGNKLWVNSQEIPSARPLQLELFRMGVVRTVVLIKRSSY